MIKRVAFFVPPTFDYLCSVILEGLRSHNIDVLLSQPYVEGRAATGLSDFIEFASHADVVLVMSNMKLPEAILRESRLQNLIYIDGMDQSFHWVDQRVNWRAVFKRELLTTDTAQQRPGIFPLPFAALNRWVFPAQKKTKLVSFLANRYNNPLRNSIHHRLRNLADDRIATGSTGECSNTGTLEVGQTVQYSEILRQSLCSV